MPDLELGARRRTHRRSDASVSDGICVGSGGRSIVIRTLIVDDEPLPRERIRSLLTAYPSIAVIGESHDGREAAATITSDRPDLIFLDVQMPELDGFDVTQSVSDGYSPEVIFVTAFD